MNDIQDLMSTKLAKAIIRCQDLGITRAQVAAVMNFKESRDLYARAAGIINSPKRRKFYISVFDDAFVVHSPFVPNEPYVSFASLLKPCVSQDAEPIGSDW